jgi:hypothetical protein
VTGARLDFFAAFLDVALVPVPGVQTQAGVCAGAMRAAFSGSPYRLA